MAGELEESKALLEAAVRGQRQVEQELSDTREQGSDMQGIRFVIYNHPPFLSVNVLYFATI